MKDNPKTIESSGRGNNAIGVIVEGERKGTAFVKTKKGTREIPFDSMPHELKELYKKY